MTAYMIFIRDEPVRDEAAMAEYQRVNRSTPPVLPIKPIVAYGAIEAVEGPAPDGVIILEFPNKEDARTWYDSPGYQAALPHRMKAADYRAFIVEGL